MSSAGDLVVGLRAELAAVAVAEDAGPMAAYMKDQFGFLGVKAKARKAAQKATIAALTSASGPELIAFADACWAQGEREFQYVAADALRRWVRHLDTDAIGDIRRLIVTKPWWDTVDLLAAHVVGPLVSADPHLLPVMDAWIDDDDMWLARTAILHQLAYKADVDTERLFAYTERRAADTEFFIRKALGWALRSCAREYPDAVRAFVTAHEDTLSGLTRREALKHL